MIRIRKATVGDTGALVELLNPIIEARVYSAMVTPCTLESQRAFIEGFPERGVYHVAEDAETGRIVGSQDLAPWLADVEAFEHVATMGTFVALDRLREGVATQLFSATFDAAHALGFTKVFTFVRADNVVALRAYLAQEFEIVGTARKHVRIDGRDVDEIMIERFL